MKKYSKIYHVNGKEFRYNYDTCSIEWLYDGEVVDEIGCYLEDWQESPKGMCEYFDNEIKEQVAGVSLEDLI